jgi:hypothetical protein
VPAAADPPPVVDREAEEPARDREQVERVAAAILRKLDSGAFYPLGKLTQAIQPGDRAFRDAALTDMLADGRVVRELTDGKSEVPLAIPFGRGQGKPRPDRDRGCSLNACRESIGRA